MKWIKPAEICGTVKAPASKSLTIRAAAAGLLSENGTRIINPSFCDDALAAFGIVKALGGDIKEKSREIFINKNSAAGRKTHLNCGESALCLRMFAPISAVLKEESVLEGSGSLSSRPIGMVERPLRQLGCLCVTNGGKPPVRISGPLKGGHASIDGSLSSQFLTGLLMALPLCEKPSKLTVSDLKSKPYITLSLSLMSDFGIAIDFDSDFRRFSIDGFQSYSRSSYSVEGDWSGASFLLVAGALKGRIKIEDLSTESHQADKMILKALFSAGAKVDMDGKSVVVEHHRLNAFEFDATESPDLFPPLVTLACACRGRSIIHGAGRLLFKESNRAESLLEEFGKIGARIKIDGDRMIIKGRRLEGGLIDTHEDHRIAMAAAVAGLISLRGVIIPNWKCVSKSYPEFFEDLESVCRRKT